uniref:Protein TIC 214 n=1 Tax=Cuscuta africana TaxID=413235 RepID=A0A7H0DGL3_9ASTE|nr:Ycf1 protein [Cuscuta africana]QNP08473.1 Ycf1 protein [Cuscuta africana]
MTAFSIKPSYLFLLRALVLEKETNTNNRVAATTGFIIGQLTRFLSIYYAPLYLALGRPHTITVLALPYLFLHLLGNIEKSFFDSGSNNRNSIRNLEITCVFLNHLILQLLNTCILPSSTLARLVSIYMFRCTNKMFFVTSSFFAWLIGQILVLNCFKLVVVWVRKNNYLRSIIRKYLVSNSIFVILFNCMFGSLLFILSIQSLGRIPSPIPTQKLSEVSKIEQREKERLKSEEERGVEKEEKSTEEDPSLFSEEKEVVEKELDWNLKEPDYKVPDSELEILEKKENQELDKSLVTLLFDYKRWTRPFRYIKNNRLEQAVRNEMSQYFFDTHQSDGKDRISFTHPISLSTFLKMIKTKIPLLSLDKTSSNTLDSGWVYRKKQKLNYLKSDLFNRISNLDKIEIGTTRTRLCISKDETKQEYLPEKFDPLFKGSYRGRIKRELSPTPPLNETSNDTSNEPVMINSLHALFFKNPQKKPFHLDSKKIKKKLFNVIENTIETNDKNLKPKSIRINEISKKIPRWSYKLITELEQISYYKNPPEDHDIRSRKGISVVIFDLAKEAKPIQAKTPNPNETNQNTNINQTKTKAESDDKDKLFLIRYPQQSDFRQGLIKDSMRSQRRKIVIEDFFNANVHSPIFFDRSKKKSFFSFAHLVKIKEFFFYWSSIKRFSTLKYTNEKKKIKKREEKKEQKRREEKERLAIGEAWDAFPATQIIRGCLLIIQSILRKNILLPSLIIGKNVGRMLLFQMPEWSEDFEELNRETHVKCTYNGVPLAEKKFPENWLTEGIQIKILFPFCIKPWYEEKSLKSRDNFCFLTVWGRETEQPFGHPRKTHSFCAPVLKEFDKRIQNMKTRICIFLKKLNPSRLKNKKYAKLSSPILKEYIRPIEKIADGNNSSPIEKLKVITDRTSTRKKKLERITEDKKRVTLELAMSLSKTSSRLALSKDFFRLLEKKKNKFKNILICKFHFFLFFIKFLRQRIYSDLFLYTLSICRITKELFMESRTKLIDKYICKNETNQKRMNKKLQNQRHFISHLKKNRFLKNSESFDDLSHLSQAYVFYKISQTGILNVRNLIYVLHKPGTSLFINNKLKESFCTQGRLQSEVLRTNQWKFWLIGNYQYDLSQILWSSLSLQKQKWQNRIKRYRRSTTDFLNKRKFGIKLKLSDYKKQKGPTSVSNKNQKDNFQKCYRYDCLSAKFIHAEKKSASVIYRSTLPVTKRQAIFFNKNMSKNNLFAITRKIHIHNLLGKIERVDIPYIEKKLDQKYLNWENLNFSLKTKVNIESWVTLNSSSNQDTSIGTYNYQLIDEMEFLKFIDKILKKEKELLSLSIQPNTELNKPNSQNYLVDWMGMNQQIFHRPFTNLEFWFFPEFVLFLNLYKTKPWIIQSNLLILNLNLNQLKSKKKKKTTNKQKSKIENQQKSETDSQPKSETDSQQKGETENQQKSETEKDLEKDSTQSNIEFFLKKYFIFQLRGGITFNQSFFKNIQIFCLLLRLKKKNKIILSFIQRRKLNLRIVPRITEKVTKNFDVPELFKKTGFFFYPLPLSIKKNGKLIMYQTISISLIQKIKHQMNKTYQKQRIIRTQDNNHFDQLILENILSSKHRRELRILICLNSNKWNGVDTNSLVCNNNISKTLNPFWDKQKKYIEFFLWPPYRLQDLACMNRYWFYTHNGSRFSMLRILMYLPLKIR